MSITPARGIYDITPTTIDITGPRDGSYNIVLRDENRRLIHRLKASSAHEASDWASDTYPEVPVHFNIGARA